ncbi:MAG: pyroglutamyl-peptidase I [Bacillota bacterium]
MSTILLTAFEPFAGDEVNPTEEVLKDFPDYLYDMKVIKTTLPVIYNHCFDTLLPLIEKYKPEVILHLGYAKGRSHVSIERVAINVNESKTPDNVGTVLDGETIISGGPDGLFTTLPIKYLKERFRSKALPAEISNTAGTYICNNLFYRTLHFVKSYNMQSKVGFIHIPAFPAMASKEKIPSMSKSTITEILVQTLDTVLNPFDIREFGQEVE